MDRTPKSGRRIQADANEQTLELNEQRLTLKWQECRAVWIPNGCLS